MTRVVLVHGAATSARVWDRLAPLLPDHDVVAVTRPRTGNLARELAWLAPHVEGAWVVGMSGGATLGLALASGPVPLAGAILHEPAVGTLAPSLLGPMVRAFEESGTTAFAHTLYGDTWTPVLLGGPVEDAVTAGELAMFRGFEPEPISATAGRVVVTVGERSPAIRHASVEALRAAYGHEVLIVPGASHFAAYDAPHEFASTLLSVIEAAQ